ncbi:MAG: ABC transporter permease, partial [Chloroflexota bacterium]|nr:ABC transporter permease [Chloroflexota bacterium]
MLALLRLVSLRHFTRSPGRTLLTLAGVALGVAALVAIDVTNGSSTATIDELVGAYAGKAQLTVSAASGTLEPNALQATAATPGVSAAAGSVQGVLLVGPDLRVALPAIGGTGDEDAVREYVLARGARPSGPEVLLGDEAARRLGVDVGDAVRALTPLGVRSLRVSGVLADRDIGRANGAFVAVLPYDTADVLYQRSGRLDAIDVVVAPGARPDDVAARLRSALPAAEVRTPEARGGQTKKLVASLQSLLQVISALSLFIGTFLVFNTMSIAVAQRKREFGILRALGIRRREIVALVTLEAAFIGVVASAAGLAIGVIMARAFLGAVNAQIRANFVAGLADQLVVPWPRLAGLLLVGVAAALVGALGPAIAAASA